MGPDKTMADNKPDAGFSIVGIGASAGGLHSLECFLEALPKDFDFAVVFIQHLSPAHKSLMPEILRSKWRDLEFIEIEDGLQLLPGRLYLCPPAIEVRLDEGAFRIIARPDEHIHFPIDEFLVSLAEASAERAIAVIFSGAGTDGVRGIQAVRAGGGTVFVQDPATAQFPELPQAAIRTGQVDSVLPPPDIAIEIVKLLISSATTEAPDKLVNPSELEPFYLLVREKTGHTFNHYKKSVISRRIRRRMYLHGVVSVSEYLDMVANKYGEAALLASDLMIGVTSFFRDSIAWKALRLEVIKKLVAGEGDVPIRVWTPACATGEESYSIAMMLRHELDFAGKKRELQVFATDVNDKALDKAREGKYPASISADVSQEFMRQFFTYSEDGMSVTVSKELRQHVIFAKQDILTDPPFSRLDLVICRNLLIYLEPDAQEKCITLFHYALRPGGYLFLGNAESPGRKSELFKYLGHKKCRVYEKVEIEPPSRLPLSIPFAAEREEVSVREHPVLDQQHSVIQFSQETLLEEYGPAAVTIDQNYNILYNNGPTKRYLTQPRGALSQNLLELMPENLRSRIRGAIYKVTQEARAVSVRAGITSEEGQKRQVSIRISRIKDNLFLIVFREKAGLPPEASSESPETVCVEEPAVRQLEIELSATRQALQRNIEQLKSLNEEQQSSNEELQAANEELETSREELQSLNEELITVNTQLQCKVEEQEETNNDLNNFLGSTNIPTLFLDHRFRVKRYTPAITKLIKLIPSDVGRQIIDMSQEHLGPDLIADAQSVLENLVPVKKEIRINNDWYIRIALPYRTFDNRIEGVVVTYNDVTELKRVEELSMNLASFPQLNPNPVIEIDSSGKVTFCNTGALKKLESLGMDKSEVEAFLPPDLAATLRNWNKGNETTIHREIIIKDRVFGETIQLLPQFDVARLYAADITERKRAEKELSESKDQLAADLDAMTRLQTLAVLFVHKGDMRVVLDKIVETAIAMTMADMGNIQLLDKQSGRLKIMAYRGFEKPFLDFWNSVAEGQGVCGTALERGGREIVEDVTQSPIFVGTPALDVQLAAGVRAIQSTPLVSRSGKVLGMFSTHFRSPHRPDERSLRLLDLLARQAADIIERAQTEEALRESEQLYRAIGESINYGVWVCAPDGRNIYASESFLKLVGMTQDQCSSFGWSEVLHPDDAERTITSWQECVRTIGAWDIEHRFRGVDGQWHPILARGVPVKNERGEVIYWAGINLDINSLKQAEEEIKRLNDDLLVRNDKLEFANKELESFIYSVSHDLRGPLRTIFGFSEIMRKEIADKLDEKGKQYFSRILDAAEKMSRLIDDLLNLSRISRQEIQWREVNLSDMALSIITDLREAHPDRSVEADIKGDLTAFADHGLIEIVLSNLFGNAWKFTSKKKQAHIEFGAAEQDGKIIYYVGDNGAGFEQKYAGKMFWPFHRLHSEAAFEGTGIGLAIVDRIISRHGGKVWAEGVEGKGATIYFGLT